MHINRSQKNNKKGEVFKMELCVLCFSLTSKTNVLILFEWISSLHIRNSQKFSNILQFFTPGRVVSYYKCELSFLITITLFDTNNDHSLMSTNALAFRPHGYSGCHRYTLGCLVNIAGEQTGYDPFRFHFDSLHTHFSNFQLFLIYNKNSNNTSGIKENK